MVPRKQAGHMTCTRPQAERQILLAMRASSTHDPVLREALGSLAAVIAEICGAGSGSISTDLRVLLPSWSGVIR